MLISVPNVSDGDIVMARATPPFDGASGPGRLPALIVSCSRLVRMAVTNSMQGLRHAGEARVRRQFHPCRHQCHHHHHTWWNRYVRVQHREVARLECAHGPDIARTDVRHDAELVIEERHAADAELNHSVQRQ